MDGGDDGFLLCPAAPLERRAGDYFGRRRRRRRRPATVRAGQDRSHESLTFPSKSNIPPWNTRRACGKKGRYLFVFHFCVCRAVSLLFLFFQIVFSRPGLFFKTFALSLPVPTIFLTSLVSFSRRLLLSIPYPPHTLSLSSRRRIEREKKIQTHLFPPFFYQCGLAIFLGRLCGIRCVCWSFFLDRNCSSSPARRRRRRRQRRRRRRRRRIEFLVAPRGSARARTSTPVFTICYTDRSRRVTQSGRDRNRRLNGRPCPVVIVCCCCCCCCCWSTKK